MNETHLRKSVGAFILLLAACAPDIRVVEVRGTVEQNGVPLRSGDMAAAGEVIDVQEGRVVLEVGERSTIRLFDKTQLAADGFGSSISLKLILGKVWSEVTPDSGAFDVETANAVAGVRGTEFIVETADGETEVRVLEGEVEFSSKSDPSKRQSVKAEQRSSVRKEGAPGEPTSYDPASDRNVWRRLGALFKEIGKKTKEAAEGIRDEAKKAAPEIKRELKEGGKQLKRDLKKIFKK